MSTLTFQTDHKDQEKQKKTKKESNAELKKIQLASLEQGITEALLISTGEMKGTPLSELWDE